jgi:CheY-like chemotaxis protein
MNTILLVEPSKTFAQFLTMALSHLGCQVITTRDAETALATVVHERPQLILSETRLPGVGGIEFCTRLKGTAETARIPFIIISTDGLLSTRQQAQQAGCSDYLTKPVTARSLHELVERHLLFDHFRHDIRVRMQLNAIVNHAGQTATLRTTSIGEGGLHLTSPAPCSVGTLLDIQLPLPGLAAALQLKGKVIYLTGEGESGRPAGMGIKFVGLDLNTTTLLRHYMESCLCDFLPHQEA